MVLRSTVSRTRWYGTRPARRGRIIARTATGPDGILVVRYRQVIAAYPDGGGAYTVARDNLGPRAGLVAACLSSTVKASPCV